MAQITISTPLYFGPNLTKYVPDNLSLPINTTVDCLWEEIDGPDYWSYVHVLTGTAAGRRGYVKRTSVSASANLYTPMFSTKYISTSQQAFYAPGVAISGSTLPVGEYIRALNKTEGIYTLAEYIDRPSGRKKRVWLLTNSLLTSSTTNYMHDSGTYNGLLLHVIRTPASNIKIATLKRTQNLAGSGEYGINGGWFNLSPDPVDTLNISIYNQKVVYGNGSSGLGGDHNRAGLGKGEIFYQNSKLQQKVIGADVVTNVSGKTWGQGGVNLFFGDSGWQAQAEAEVPRQETYITGTRDGRTAIVANITLDEVYLIVTNNNNTTIAFRTAIHDYLGISKTSPNTHYKGMLVMHQNS